MNPLAALTVLFALLAIGLYVWGDKNRIRKNDLQSALDDAERTISHLRHQISGHLQDSIATSAKITNQERYITRLQTHPEERKKLRRPRMPSLYAQRMQKPYGC